MDDLERKIRDKQIKVLEEEIEEIYNQWESSMSDEQRLQLQRRIDQKLSRLKTLDGNSNREYQERKRNPVTFQNPTKQKLQSFPYRFIFSSLILVTVTVSFWLLFLKDQTQITRVSSSSTPQPNIQTIIKSADATKTAKDFFDEGYAKQDKGDKQGALSAYNEAIRLNPKYIRAYARRGLLFAALGQDAKSKDDFQKAISLNAKTADDYLGQGTAKFALGDKQGAIADYNESIRLNPDNANPYNNRGNAKYGLGDRQGSLADYNEAIRLNPNDVNAYNNRGNVKSDLGDKQGAIADYNEAIRINPNDVNAYYNRGNMKFDLGDKQGSLADYNEAIRINPNEAQAYVGRGNRKSDLGDKQGAIADYNEAIRLNPNDIDAYYNRANRYKQLGEKQKALADYRELARIYQQQGKITDYEDAQNKIRELGG